MYQVNLTQVHQQLVANPMTLCSALPFIDDTQYCCLHVSKQVEGTISNDQTCGYKSSRNPRD